MTNPFVVGGLEMDLPIMVGGGVCKTPESILPFMRADVPVGAVETGSYTLLARTGNEGILFHPDSLEDIEQSGFGLNSFGMPNSGFEVSLDLLRIRRSQHTKPLIVNIAGFSVEDYIVGTNTFNVTELISAIVANMGCPNAHDGKAIPIAYDTDTLKRIFDVTGELDLKVPYWLKLSPYITEEHRQRLQTEHPEIDFSHAPVVKEGFIQQVCELIAQYPFIKAVIASNTLGNCIYQKDGKAVTTPNGGKAGLSGPILRPISVGLVRDFRALLPDHIDIIGCGGITHGDHVVEYLEAGAAGVQCTSGPFWSGNGPRWFADLIQGSERLQNHLSARM